MRAVRWQRIARPVRVRDTRTTPSTELLTDHWLFTPGSTSARGLIGHDFSQSAPARVARNLPLPTVHSHPDPPFVVCSKHPNGAVAVAALQRSLKQQIVSLPASVEIEIGAGRHPIGIFGVFDSLTLITDHSTDYSALQHSRIYAQDLAQDSAVDITHACKWEGRSLVVPGSVLVNLCRQNQHPDDLSLPGMVLRLA